MRILYAVHGYKPAYRIGGPVVSVMGLAENLVKRGHQVVVFTSNSNLNEDLDVPVNQPVMVDGVEVWYFKHEDILKKYLPFIPYWSQSIGYLYMPSLRKILDQRIREFDLVHTHMPFVYPTYAVARAAIRNNIPLFYHQRGAFAQEYLHYRGLKKRIYISLFEKPIMKRAAFLVALAQADVESYRGLGLNTPCRIIPNGIDMSDYAQNKGAELRLADHFVIEREDIVILFLARLHMIKGADFLLDVFLQIFNRFPRARLILAGPDQQSFREKLLLQVGEAGAQDKVFIPGMVTGDLKRNLLARADLLCQPSLAEGFSVSILEGMASAAAVLATPACNFSALEENSAGWIVVKDSQRWVDKISCLLENPSQLSSAGQKGLELVRTHYTWGKIVDQLEELYKEGLQQAGRNPQVRKAAK